MGTSEDDDIRTRADREAILARRRRFVAAALTGLTTSTLATACPCLKMAPAEPEQPDGDGQPRDDGDPVEEASPEEGAGEENGEGAGEAAEEEGAPEAGEDAVPEGEGSR